MSDPEIFVFDDDDNIELGDLHEYEYEEEEIDTDLVVNNFNTMTTYITSLLHSKYPTLKDKFLAKKINNFISLFEGKKERYSRIVKSLVPVIDTANYFYPHDKESVYIINPDKDIPLQMTTDYAIGNPPFDSQGFYKVKQYFEEAVRVVSPVGFMETQPNTTSVIFSQMRLLENDRVNITGWLAGLGKERQHIDAFIDETPLYTNEGILLYDVNSDNFQESLKALTYNPRVHISMLPRDIYSIHELRSVCETDPFEYVDDANVAKRFLEDNLFHRKRERRVKSKHFPVKSYSHNFDTFTRNVKIPEYAKKSYVDGKLFRFKCIKNRGNCGNGGGDLIHYMDLLSSDRYNNITNTKYSFQYVHDNATLSKLSSSADPIIRSYYDCLKDHDNQKQFLLLQDTFLSTQKIVKCIKNEYGYEPDQSNPIKTQVFETLIHQDPNHPKKLVLKLDYLKRLELFNHTSQIAYYIENKYDDWQGKTHKEDIPEMVEEFGTGRNNMTDNDDKDDENYEIDESNATEVFVFTYMQIFDIYFEKSYFDNACKVVQNIFSQVALGNKKKKKGHEELLKGVGICAMVALIAKYKLIHSKKLDITIEQIEHDLCNMMIRNVKTTFPEFNKTSKQQIIDNVKNFDRFIKKNAFIVKYEKNHKTTDTAVNITSKYNMGPIFDANTLSNENKSIDSQVPFVGHRDKLRQQETANKMVEIEAYQIDMNEKDIQELPPIQKEQYAYTNLKAILNRFLLEDKHFDKDPILRAYLDATTSREEDNVIAQMINYCKSCATTYTHLTKLDVIQTIQNTVLLNDVGVKVDLKHIHKILSEFMLFEFKKIFGIIAFDFKFNEKYINAKTHLPQAERKLLVNLFEKTLFSIILTTYTKEQITDLILALFQNLYILSSYVFAETDDIFDRVLIMYYVFHVILDKICDIISIEETKKSFLKIVYTELEKKLVNNEDDFQKISLEFEKEREERKQKLMERLKKMTQEQHYEFSQLKRTGMTNDTFFHMNNMENESGEERDHVNATDEDQNNNEYQEEDEDFDSGDGTGNYDNDEDYDES